MTNEARFTINGTPSEDSNGNRWYIGSHNETLSVAMEAPPIAALAVQYEVYSPSDENAPYSSKNAPIITWNESGTYSVTPAVPTDTVTIDLPAIGVVSYLIRASVILSGGGNHVFERMVSIRTTLTSPLLRKSVPAETSEFERRGISDHLNDIVDAIQSLANSGGGGDGCTLDAAYDYGGQGMGRWINVDSGPVTMAVINDSACSALEIYQNDVINNPAGVMIGNAGTGPSISLSGGGSQSIRAENNLLLAAADEVHFEDHYLFLSNWGWDYMPFSLGASEWLIARGLLGDTEGSLLGLIAAAAAYGMGDLDDAYDYPTDGAGRTITVDSGSVAFTVPATGTDTALALSNLNDANGSAVLVIDNDATLSSGYAIYLQGDAGGDDEDHDEFGHRVWTHGSLTIGHGDLSAGIGNSRSYTNYHFVNDSGSYAAATMKAEGEASWANCGYVKTFVGNDASGIDIFAGGGNCTINIEVDHDGAGNGGDINISSSDDIWLNSAELIGLQATYYASFKLYPTGGSAADIRFSDYYIYNNWIYQYIGLSDGSAESLQYTLDFGQVSIFNALHQLYTSSGSVSRPDKEIVWGTGPGVSSNAHFSFDDDYDQVRIINNHNETDWYDTYAASLLLQGSATQGNCIVANGNLTIGTLHSTINNTLLLAARNTDATSAYHPNVEIEATPIAGNAGGDITVTSNYSGNGSGGIDIVANGPGGEGYLGGNITLLAHAGTSSDQIHEIALINRVNTTEYYLKILEGEIQISSSMNNIDFENTYLEAIGGCDFGGSYSNVVTSNAFNFNPDNGINQRVTINANTTWSLTTPGGCTRTTLWVTNSDTSAHTLTLTGSPTVKWFGGETDGFSVPASSECIVTVIYDTNKDWAIAASQEYV